MKLRKYWEKNIEDPVLSQVSSKTITDQAAVEYTDIYAAISRLSPSEIESAIVAGQYGVQDNFHFADWKDIQACARRDYMKLSDDTKAQFKSAEDFYSYVSNPENYEMFEEKLMFKTEAYALKQKKMEEQLMTLENK